MAGDPKSPNVVALRPGPVAATPPPCEDPALANVLTFCEQMQEGLSHVTAALISLESRIKRLELAAAKAEKQKLASVAIYDGHGDRVR